MEFFNTHARLHKESETGGPDRRPGPDAWAEMIPFRHATGELVNNSSTKLGRFSGFLGENEGEKQQKASILGY
jgi:hypothetical protein